MSLLWLACTPSDKSAALAVGQSCLAGLDDSTLSDHLSKNTGNQITELASIMPTSQLKSLFDRIGYLVANNDIRGAIETVVDHSDLLRTFPREGDRRDVNNWLALFEKIMEKVGGDAALAQIRLRELAELGDDGPKSSSDAEVGAVKILTIHSSKGLESPIVVLHDIFNIGTKDSSFSAKENVLVTPEMIAGRIHPWRGVAKPESGLWSLASMLEYGQGMAERRRQFYVALTRAEDRIIIVGSPQSGVSISSEGYLELKRGKTQPNMGYMLLDGLAHSSIVAGNEGCVWSDGGLDQTGKVLQINPGSLLNNNFLPSGCVSGMAIFHHPSCFDSMPSQSPLEKWKKRLDVLEKSTQVLVERPTRKITHEIGLLITL